MRVGEGGRPWVGGDATRAPSSGSPRQERHHDTCLDAERGPREVTTQGKVDVRVSTQDHSSS